MRNSTFSRLALFGLAAVSTFAFAANTVMGDIRFDARFTTSQKMQDGSSADDSVKPADNLFISRARLNFAGDIAKNWMWNVRAEYNEYENAQIGLDASVLSGSSLPVLSSVTDSINAVFSRAYVSWNGLEGLTVAMGRIGTPDISADNLYYKPYIGNWPNNKSVGSLVDYSGDHAGFSVVGKAGPVGYTFGVWKQTDMRKLESLTSATDTAGATTFSSTVDLAESHITSANFDDKSLRLGYGGRLTFSPAMSGNASYGVGIGYNSAPLNMPVAIATVESLGVASPSAAVAKYTVASFNTLTNFAVDAAAVFGAFQVNAGYAQQDMKFDDSQAYGVTTAASQIFDHNGKANAWWIEAGYLFMGEYKFDSANAVVGGVKLREGQAGLEITARFGTETRKNALALLNANGYTDFSSLNTTGAAAGAQLDSVTVSDGSNPYILLGVDNTGTTANTQITIDGSTAYEAKSTGYAVNVNYYLTENAVLKAEFEQRNNKFQRGTSASYDSLNAKNVSTIRLRAEFMF